LGRVLVLDGRTGKVVGKLTTGPGPKAVAVNPNNGRVYVTEETGIGGDSAVAVFDGHSKRQLATIPIGPYETYFENPLGIAVNPRSNTVYVTNPLDGTLYTIDGATNAVARSVAIGDQPTAVAVGPGGAVFVAGSHGVSVLHPSGAITHVAMGSRTRGIAVDPRSSVAYATTDAGNVVAVSHGVTSVVAHGDKPWGIAVGNGGTIVIADARRGSIEAFERRSAIAA
jgi:YVTN family beta-propeller protein